MGRRMDVQFQLRMLEPTDPINILSFLPTFQKECDANGTQEG